MRHFYFRLIFGIVGCQCCESKYFLCRFVCGIGYRIPVVCLFNLEKGEGQR